MPLASLAREHVTMSIDVVLDIRFSPAKVQRLFLEFWQRR
jgi:hypothetical protein